MDAALTDANHDSASSSVALFASLLPFEAITAENLLEEEKKTQQTPERERTQREKVALLSE